MRKKQIIILASISLIGIIFFANFSEANSPPPHYVNSAIDWVAVIYAFVVGTSIEIILGYLLLRRKRNWFKAVIVANLFSYPVFIGVLSFGGSFFSLFSAGQPMQSVVIIGELIVIFLESLIVRKIIGNEISFAKSLTVISVLNLASWIVGSQLVNFLFSEKFPYKLFEVHYIF
jgi:hypothetical protein